MAGFRPFSILEDAYKLVGKWILLVFFYLDGLLA
jgi:hypothetical protein